jgi:transposase
MHNTRARASAPINFGCNISIVAAIRLEQGIIAAMTTEGAFDGALFLAFIKEILVPTLRKGDHVLMDNLGAHRTAGVVEAIEASGADVIWLPPYSPDYDPVEPLWSNFKAWMRGQAARTKEALEAAIAQGLGLVTPTQVAGWYKGSGYV